MSGFNPTILRDGLPLLEMQFGLKSTEFNEYSDVMQEALLCALEVHMSEISQASRRDLSNVVRLARVIAQSA